MDAEPPDGADPFTTTKAAFEPPAPAPIGNVRRPRLRLFALSFLMLFAELALIRWTGSNLVYLSYFSNFVLLGSFLGIGVGFLRARAKTNLFPWAPVALAGLVLFIYFVPVAIDREGSDLIFFGSYSIKGLPIWVMLPALFVAAATTMALIAEGVARQFAHFPALEAYRLDILGSIVGILAFSLLAFVLAPPIVWGLIVAALFVWLGRKEARGRVAKLGVVAIVAMLATLTIESAAPQDRWSPYYKIRLTDEPDGSIGIKVNGIPHQRIASTAERRINETFYFLPYERRAEVAPPGRVLIVGAGTGNDVAIALAQGVQHVDAVEIDPSLHALGVQLHPDRPYASPNVTTIINDGRAFLEQTDRTYDMILFALPDSLTLVSGQSSLRLESYLFTAEALTAARNRLEPNGTFAMYNFYREDWLIDRLANTLQLVFGGPPCADVFGPSQHHLAVLQASMDSAALDCPTPWAAPEAGAPAPASDDHPFLYLRGNSIPAFYLVTIALILAGSVFVVRRAAGSFRPMKGYLDLFFMGCAFLLLETKNVVNFALLFGTTWFVNALVFAGILLTVLAAIEVARRVRVRNLAAVYAALLGALMVAWLVPTAALLVLPTPLRFLAATALAFAPVFLANLVFAERFRETENAPTAFAANLLGAMVGGLVEYAALVIGYRALLVLTGVFYGLAFLAWRVQSVRQDQPAPAVA